LTPPFEPRGFPALPAALRLAGALGAPFAEGTALSNVFLEAFTDRNLNATAGDFKATVDWGDGTGVQSAIVTQTSPGNFSVSGNHTYLKPGMFPIQVSITDTEFGGDTLNQTVGPLTITDPALVAAASAPPTINTEVNAPLTDVLIGQFTDPNALAKPSDFAADVTNWGDGLTSGATVVETSVDGSGAHFAVFGSHTYAATLTAGTISLSVQDVNGSNAAVTLRTPSVNVGSSPIGVSVLPITTTVGSRNAQGQLIATFTDPAEADLTTLPGPLTASIAWGDGSPPDTLGTGVTLNAMGGGVFGVIAPAGGHIYATPGIYTITVTVNDSGASGPSSGVGGSTADVAPGTITAAPFAGTGLLAPGTEGAPLAANTPPPAGASGVELATFTSTDTTLGASGYSGLIDWGDGSPQSVGQVTADLVADAVDPTHAHFVVTGEHTYHEAQNSPYTITVSISQNSSGSIFSSQTVSVTDTVTINEASLAAGSALPIFATAHVPLNDVPVATFTDPNQFGSAGDFTASINWGDGSGVDPNARVVQTGGTAAGLIYTVYGSHQYNLPGNFATAVTVHDKDGATLAIPPVAPPPGSGNVTVNKFTTTTTLNAVPNQVDVGSTVNLTAAVTGGTGAQAPTGTVTFKEGANTIGTVNLVNGSATLSTSGLALGVHSITAVYNGDANNSGSTSSPQTVTVSSPVIPGGTTPVNTNITNLVDITRFKAKRRPAKGDFVVPIHLHNTSGKVIIGARMFILGLPNSVKIEAPTFTGLSKGVPGVPDGTPFLEFSEAINAGYTVFLHVKAPSANAAANAYGLQILAGS
jgi:hypothetical protein